MIAAIYARKSTEQEASAMKKPTPHQVVRELLHSRPTDLVGAQKRAERRAKRKAKKRAKR